MGYAETVGGLELARGPWLGDPCSDGMLIMTVRRESAKAAHSHRTIYQASVEQLCDEMILRLFVHTALKQCCFVAAIGCCVGTRTFSDFNDGFLADLRVSSTFSQCPDLFQ